MLGRLVVKGYPLQNYHRKQEREISHQLRTRTETQLKVVPKLLVFNVKCFRINLWEDNKGRVRNGIYPRVSCH